MWPFSGAALNELVQSHTAVSRLDVIRGGKSAYTLVVTAGSISAQANRSTLRNMTATATDPTGQLSGSDINDLLNPYSCQVAPYRGVVIPSTGALVYAPLGVYQLTNRSVTGDGSIDITGQDRAIIYQGGMTATLAISSGTPIETAIQKLLVTRNRALQFRTWNTGFTTGPLIFAPDIDVWKEAQTLAQSVGGYLYHDRRGLLTFSPALPTNARPMRSYTEGDGLLLGVKRAENSDTIHNVVVVEKEAGSTIRATMQDTDPTSPTFAGGKYGRRVLTIQNPHVGTVTQAQQAARNELMKQLGRSETVSIDVVPDPTLDPLDPITVNRPSASLKNTGLTIDTITLPLDVQSPMNIVCRKYLLTQDGTQVSLPSDPLTVA